MRQQPQHLLRNDLPKPVAFDHPVREYAFRPARLGLPLVLLDQRAADAFPVFRANPLIDHRIGIDAVLERVVDVVDERHAARHAGREVVADGSQQHRRAAGHIFAAVGAAALHDGDGPRVAHREAFARLPGGEQLAGGRAIEHRVADDGVPIGRDGRGRHRTHDDDSAGQALADIVVGLAEDLQLQPLHRERAERLPRRAAQPDRDVPRTEPGHAVTPGDPRRELGADRPHRVLDVVLKLHLLAVLEQGPGVLDHLRIQRLRHLVAPLDRAITRRVPVIRLGEQGVEVEIVEMLRAAAHLPEQVGAADHVADRPHAERGERLAHLFGNEAEQVHDLLGRASELGAQRRLLRANPHRTGVGVTLAHEDAAHGDQRRRADAELLGAQHRRDDDVAAGLDAAVDAQAHPMPEPVQRQHLVHLRQSHLPGRARVFDRRLRRRAGAAGMTGNQDDVRVRLGDARRDRPDPGARDELDADRGLGVDLLEVVDELRQILDRIDIVMRRRRNQRNARRRMAEIGDQLRHLDARQLAALAGLCALGDLDLDLAAVVQVFRGDAEPAGRDLLDGARRVVAVRLRLVARRIFAAFAGIRFCADPVHRDRQGFMRLRRQSAQ